MKKIVSWVEIPAKNIERAANFYSKILSIDLEVLDFGEEKMACFPGGEGAISQAPDFNPSREGVLVSLNPGAHLDSLTEKVEELGGKLVRPRTKIEAERRGYFCIIEDCEGNSIGLYED